MDACHQGTVLKSTLPSPRLKTSKASSFSSILTGSLLLLLFLDGAGKMPSPVFSLVAMMVGCKDSNLDIIKECEVSDPVSQSCEILGHVQQCKPVMTRAGRGYM